MFVNRRIERHQKGPKFDRSLFSGIRRFDSRLCDKREIEDGKSGEKRNEILGKHLANRILTMWLCRPFFLSFLLKQRSSKTIVELPKIYIYLSCSTERARWLRLWVSIIDDVEQVCEERSASPYYFFLRYLIMEIWRKIRKVSIFYFLRRTVHVDSSMCVRLEIHRSYQPVNLPSCTSASTIDTGE